MISLATETERTLFFDFLPVDLGTIRGLQDALHRTPSPAGLLQRQPQAHPQGGRHVFVGDSQIERMEANVESMQNLYDNMAEYGYDLTRIPFVIQYNKRDLPNAAADQGSAGVMESRVADRDATRQKQTPDPAHPGREPRREGRGEWVGRAAYHELWRSAGTACSTR